MTADSLFCRVKIFTKAVLLVSILQAQTRGCRGCRENQVTWRRGNAAQNDTCLPCADCPDGMEPSIPCGTVAKYGTHLHCVACREGTYSNNYGKDQCIPCSLCLEGRTVTRNCSATKNTICGSCIYGYYKNDVVLSCLPCSACCWDGRDQLESKCIAQGLPRHRQCRPRHGDRCQLSTTNGNTKGRVVITSVQRISQTGKTTVPPISTTKHSRTETRPNENTAASLALSTTARQPPMKTLQQTTTSQTTANQSSIETTLETLTSLSFTDSTVNYGKARKSMLDNSKNKTRVIIAVSFSMVALTLVVVIIKRKIIARYLRWARCRPVCRSRDSELGERTESSMIPEEIRVPVAVQVKRGVLCPMKFLKSVSLEAYEKVWKRLDKKPEGTKKGDFRSVAEEFGFAQEDIWEFEKEFKTSGSGSPTRQLLETLETRRPELTVLEFIKVLQKPNIDRDDIVDILKLHIFRCEIRTLN